MAATRPRALPLLQQAAAAGAAETGNAAEELQGPLGVPGAGGGGGQEGGEREQQSDDWGRGGGGCGDLDVKPHHLPIPHHDDVLLGTGAVTAVAAPNHVSIKLEEGLPVATAPPATATTARARARPKAYLPAVKKPPGPPQVVEEYQARLYFRGSLCVEGDPYAPEDSATHNLFHYTSLAYKDHVLRFDPSVYPVEGGLEGPGAIRLIRDVKNCYAESLNLHRGSPHLRDAQRRLFCLRGDIRKSSHIVQTCRCNVHLIIRTDPHSHYLKCGKGCSTHTGHARVVDLSKFRPLPDSIAPREVAATGEVADGYHPDQVVVVSPDLVPPAQVSAGIDEIVAYPARVAFEGAPCLLDERYDRSKLTALELFSYTHPKFKHMVVRFDPDKYPTEGGFDGEGWKALMADLKDRSDDPLCLHSVAVQDRDRLRRLCCRRGQMHHAKFVVQTCHCPVRLLVHRDDQTFFLKCGEGGSVHQGHPPLPKVYSQKGIPKRKYNPDGSLHAGAAAGEGPASASSGAKKADEEPLILPHSKTAKRLWPYVTQLVEALEGQPWQKVDAAGRQVQEIAEAIVQRKRERDGGGRGEDSSSKPRKRQRTAAAASASAAAFQDDDDATPLQHQHPPPPQVQQQPPPPYMPPPHGQPHHQQALYHPFQPQQQNLYWL